MKYSDQLITEIQDANDIVEIIGQFVELKKNGAYYKGLCPFHNERTPSFTVTPSKKIFKCFGCDKGGTVFNFLMEIENVTFIEAVKMLAEKARIELPEMGKEDSRKSSLEESLYEVNRWAARNYYDNLKSESGEFARNYLEKRGITREMMVKFGVGYALNEWSDLPSAAYRDQFRIELLETVGLVYKKDNGDGYNDRFRHRLIFPIQDAVGRVVGFGGRVLDPKDHGAKYINSPDSLIYHKSFVLYGLYHAKEAIRKKDEVIMVEGYLDVIALHQAGFEHVVATSGTALTIEQIRLIKRYTKRNFIFLYDGDNAGLKAMERSMELLFEEGLFPQIVTLPDGHDPDSYIRDFGSEKFEDALRIYRKSFLQFVNDFESSKVDVIDPSVQQQIVKKISTLISRFPDPIGREFLIREVAKFTRITEGNISDLVKSAGKSTQQKNQQLSQRQPPNSPPEETQQPLKTKITMVEAELLKIMLEFGNSIIEYISYFIEPFHFHHTAAKEIYELLLQMVKEERLITVNNVIHSISDPSLISLVTKLSTEKYSISEKWKERGFHREQLSEQQWVEDSIIKLRMNYLERQEKEVIQELKLKESDEHDIQIMNQLKIIQKEKNRLLSRDIFNSESDY